MPIVDIKGVGKAQFPDDMPIEDIKAFLQRKYASEATNQIGMPERPNMAAPYEPSLVEKMGQGIGTALEESGIISNRGGAQETGRNVAAIGEFLPGIGDATAGDDFGRAAREGDVAGMALGSLAAIPVVGSLARKGAGKIIKNVEDYKGGYPLDDFDSWWGDRTYKEQGADMLEMTPDEYLSQVKPLKMDEETLENVDDLVSHMESGRKLDPLVIYADGKEDGRHRALAAKKLGLNSVPVIDYRKDGGTSLSVELPMDEASRAARAGEQGFEVDAFHGTTHDFPEFGSGRFEKEGHFGGGHYFSSDIDDVNRNYAGAGPDLTNRIERRKEMLESEFEDMDEDELSELASKWEVATSDPDDIANKIATSELQGNQGLVIPSKLNPGKEFDLIEDTKLGYERETPDWEDYLDDADGDEDMARDLAFDASYENEPTGELADFMESLRNQADENGFEVDEVVDRINEIAMDSEGISATELDDIMRNTEWYAEDPETGSLINNEVYRQALEDAGFDSIKHSGDIFQGMDIPQGTEHRIIFDPSRIRSKFAKFDPKNIGKANLLGGVAGAGIAVKAMSEDENKKKGLN